MDIRNWGIGRIMQLPDFMFGSRWPISLSAELTDADPVFAISSSALPEWCVIHEINGIGIGAFDVSIDVGLALGDQLPASQAMFAALEVAVPSLSSRTSGLGHFECPSLASNHMVKCRHPLHTAGRRIVARFIRGRGTANAGVVDVVVSSVPTDIAEWLLRRTGHQGEKW